MTSKPLDRAGPILLVEDNPGDVRLVQEALKECGWDTCLHVVQDGEEALAFLRSREPRPAIILLDLNLPKRNGQEVLEDIKTDPDLKQIPVIIFTASHAETDILRAYEMHANCYVTKPIQLDDFILIIHMIGRFWLQTAQLPPG